MLSRRGTQGFPPRSQGLDTYGEDRGVPIRNLVTGLLESLQPRDDDEEFLKKRIGASVIWRGGCRLVLKLHAVWDALR